MLYVFDMGNVVITHIHCLEAIARAYHLDEERFLADYRSYDVPLMEGSVPTPVYWAHVERRFGVAIQGEPFAEFFHPVPNPDVMETIARLRREGKRVVCGSNTIGPHWDILSRMGLTDGLFDATYPSHMVRLSKPEPEYYRYILDHERTDAESSWFIDDYRWNTDAAAKVGMHALQYDWQSEASHVALRSL
ncbi:MAG: HAD-IA family hydrolase [Sphaerochaetaceae bacterium]